MKVVDNFELIKPLFYFNEGNGLFFHVQIVPRNKDHAKSCKERTIQTYFVQSREELERRKPVIIQLCRAFGARAYINVSGKDFSELNKQLLFKMAEYNVRNHQNINPLRIVNKVAGSLKSRIVRWILDVDDTSLEYRTRLMDWLNKEGLTEMDWFEIPTVSGYHLILKKKVNTKILQEQFPDLALHKNSMGTLLYYEGE